MLTSEEVLQTYWGYASFRPLQKEIIDSVLEGNDTLALLPTGGGKSVCFQVPALCMEGLCLVISPLIALMKDQVMNLKNRGIEALLIHSAMNFQEIEKTLKNAAYGNFKFLYVSPERLKSNLFLDYLPILNIKLIAVDEAHCISQWGYEFRPAYLQIAEIREHLPSVNILALTASATPIVQKDICKKLLFEGGKTYQQSFARPNLSYSSLQVPYKQNKLIDILQRVPGTAIVYCRSRKRTQQLAELLNLNKISAAHYHAGLSHKERNEKQNDWVSNNIRVMVCTNAFGMGIDKPDVRLVIHTDIPEALENYYQEAGRAGRDSEKAYAVLLYTAQEPEEMHAQAHVKYPSVQTIKKIYGALCNFFQLPSGKGEGLSYDFNLGEFVNNFKLDALVVTNVLKILEQEELLSYTEDFFMPSTVVFTTGKRQMEDFLEAYPSLDSLVKGLLRSYEGIFDFPAPIFEDRLAKFIEKDIKTTRLMLKQLHSHRIIHYSPQKEEPQITFLQNRVKAEDLRLDEKALAERKNNYLKRLEAMKRFVLNKSLCRSRMIALYFGAPLSKDCGICDNCVENKKRILNMKEFREISVGIEKITVEGSVSTRQVYDSMKEISYKKIDDVLHWMVSERKISIDAKGHIIKKGPR